VALALSLHRSRTDRPSRENVFGILPVDDDFKHVPSNERADTSGTIAQHAVETQ
jgi:hypothetical protein